MRDSLRELHKQLLPGTFSNAIKTAFYRDLFGDRFVDGINLQNLHEVPFTFRNDIKSAGDLARIRSASDKECFTGGTTGGAMPFFISQQENDFLRRFFSEVDGSRQTAPINRMVHFVDPAQATSREIQPKLRTHDLSVYVEGSFDYAKDLLSSCHKEEGVNLL